MGETKSRTQASAGGKRRYPQGVVFGCLWWDSSARLRSSPPHLWPAASLTSPLRGRSLQMREGYQQDHRPQRSRSDLSPHGRPREFPGSPNVGGSWPEMPLLVPAQTPPPVPGLKLAQNAGEWAPGPQDLVKDSKGPLSTRTPADRVASVPAAVDGCLGDLGGPDRTGNPHPMGCFPF